MTSVLRFYDTYIASTGNGTAVVGDTKTSVTTSDHNGWLLCDGRLVTAKAFPYLFNAIGYTFGGSAGTFRLPDGRGRVTGNVNTATVGGPVDMNGNPIAQRPLGTVTGEETHTLTVPEMPSHAHTITDPGHTHTGTTDSTSTTSGTTNNGINIGGSYNVATNGVGHTHTFTTNSRTTGITVNPNGSSAAHNTMQPTVYMGNLFVYSGMKDLNTSTPFIFN
jgi:microcystin-dependent protein